jgi:hypothetical protein
MSEMQGSVDAGNPGGEAAPGQGQGSSQAWYGAYPEEVRGLVETKGWQSPVDAINSYSNLEKLLGADKAGRGLVLPKDDAPADEWGKVYDRLGRPKSSDEYKLPIPDGDTGEFAKVAAGKFHELGLSAKQAQGLAEWWNATQAEMGSSQANSMAMNSEMEMEQLQKEWGPQYDANIEAGRRAARQFGVDAPMLEKMESALGTAEMLKFFAKVGKGMGEDAIVEGSSSGKFGISPEAARVRIQQLKADPEWTAKYLSGNADAKAELERLMRAGFPA